MEPDLSQINHEYADRFAGRYALVPGEGDAFACLMLVGEAPGAQEAREGRPFVGPAGRNLDAFLAGVGLVRPELYVTNAVKFRPTKAGKGGREVNRTPVPAEVAAFRPWLLAEIEAVRPRVVATLGNTALWAVAGEALAIGDVHGRPLSLKEGVTLFPLYHPASILYRQALRPVYEADIAALKAYLIGMDG